MAKAKKKTRRYKRNITNLNKKLDMIKRNEKILKEYYKTMAE